MGWLYWAPLYTLQTMKNQRIRAVDTLTRAVTTVAGDGTSATLNGPGASARFKCLRPTWL